MSSTLESFVMSLSLSDKLALNQLLASSIANSMSESNQTPNKIAKPAKRPTSQGVLAWNAFIKHCKLNYADRFTHTKLEKERLIICKDIKASDPSAYSAFVTQWRVNAVSPTSTITPAPATGHAPAPPPASVAPSIFQSRNDNTESILATSVPSSTDDEGDMQKKILKGKKYLMDPMSKNLYATDNNFEAVGEYCGRFRPGNDLEPIDIDAEEA